MAGRLADKRTLVVEDEYFIASDLARALRDEGAVVIGPAGDTGKAENLASDGPLDGAVLDVNLDGVMSYPLANALAERNVPCMFVTGYEGDFLPEAYRDAPRMTKPFSLPAVVDAVVALVTDRPSG